MRKILAAKPSITSREIDYVSDAVTNGWGEHCYDYLLRFQIAFKQYLNCPFGLATSSCTGALHIAFAAMGLKAGDEVIVPDATWIASVSPIVQLGAKLVFVDVEPESWCIDPIKIEAAITPNTKAILVVHLYGNLANMDAIMALSKKYNLYVVEDAAEALGSEYKGRKAGSIGDFGVFSFHGTKTMTTGEGGMLVSNNPALFNQASIVADHGRDPKVPKLFWCEQIGLKYKMSNLQAAIGLAQLERVEELVNHKRWVFKQYQSGLETLDLQINPEPQECFNSYWMPTVLLPVDSPIKQRDRLIDSLIENGVQARPFFYPVSSFPMMESMAENTISINLSARGINLPSYFDMTEQDISYVIKQLFLLLNE